MESLDNVTMMSPVLLTKVLETSVSHDTERAVHPQDHEVLRATEAARSLVLELLASHEDVSRHESRDLFTACARLGGLMAELGASPTLAAGVIDNAVRALASAELRFDRARIAPARASLLEGFVATIREAERTASLRAWEPPSCLVGIEPGVVAVACGYPSDDEELLGEWAARLAIHLVKAKTKRALLTGPKVVVAEVESALALVGVATVLEAPPEEKKSWLRLPWRR